MMQVFTLGQVAKICKVAPRTVANWFDSGRLKGYRIPGTQDRRIPREDLVQFLKRHGMPLGDLDLDVKPFTKILFSSREELISQMTDHMTRERLFEAKMARSNFELMILFESFDPDCIIVDFSVGIPEALEICMKVSEWKKNKQTLKLLAVLPPDCDKNNPRLKNLLTDTDGVITEPPDQGMINEIVRMLN